MQVTTFVEVLALLAGGGGVGWLVKALVDLYKSRRTADRDDFAIAFDRLRGQVDVLITRNDTLRKELDQVYAQLRAAETQIAKLEAFIRTLAQMTSEKCPYDDERCPIRAWIRAEAEVEARGV